MATFTETIPGVDMGILMPQLAHRFRVRYGRLRECSNEAANVLSMQTKSLTLDLVTDTYKLEIEQPAAYGQEFIEVIRSMCQYGFLIKAEGLDGNTTVTAIILDENVWVEKHHFALDYAQSGSMVHTLTLKPGPRPLTLL